MIVFIEGPDGSGKTRLCDTLKDFGYNSVTQLSEHNELYNWLKISIISDMLKETVIVDRASFISDLVYRLVDKKPRWGMNLKDIGEVMSKNVKIVYCKTDSAFMDAMNRGEDVVTTEEHHKLITKTYDIIMDMFKIFSDVSILEYNWKTDNVSKVIKFIEGGTINESV